MRCAMFLGLTIVLATPAALMARGVPAELVGTWHLVSVESGGRPPEAVAGRTRLVIGDGSVRYGGTEVARIVADPIASPKTIDLAFADPNRTYEGIYSVEGDTLLICLNAQSGGVKERPGALTTTGHEGWRLLRFRRVAPDLGDPKAGLRAFVGLQIRDDAETKALVVDATLDGSPARASGLLPGDRIVAVGGVRPAGLRRAVEAIRAATPGGPLVVRIARDAKEIEVTIRPGLAPFGQIAELY